MYRLPCGTFNTTYKQDMALFRTKFLKFWVTVFFIFLLVFPFVANVYLLSLANIIGIAVVGALGLNILTGFAGQISLGHGAFIGVGAYTSALLVMRLHIPFWFALPVAGLFTAIVGMIFGIPSLRVKGLYLAIATLAAQVIINFVMIHWSSLTKGTSGLPVDPPKLFGIVFDTDQKYYFITMIFAVLATTFAKNLQRTRVGRAFMAVRDNDLAAEIIGINLFKYKLLAFFVSSFYAGIAGALWAHYVTIITPEHFTIAESINYLAMIIIGGIGSVLGSIFGAIFMVLLPEVLRLIADALSGVYPSIGNFFSAMREVVFGLTIILFLIYEPDGLNHRWQMIKAYWKLWPFSY